MAFSQRPFGLSMRAMYFFMALLASILYFSSPVALKSAAAPMAAKHSEKMFEGAIVASPARFRAK